MIGAAPRLCSSPLFLIDRDDRRVARPACPEVRGEDKPPTVLFQFPAILLEECRGKLKRRTMIKSGDLSLNRQCLFFTHKTSIATRQAIVNAYTLLSCL